MKLEDREAEIDYLYEDNTFAFEIYFSGLPDINM
jgi:hypothetical protein